MPRPKGHSPETLKKGRIIYDKRASGAPWKEIGSMSLSGTIKAARIYAKELGRPWPPGGKQQGGRKPWVNLEEQP